jgi:CBS domain-containing protein
MTTPTYCLRWDETPARAASDMVRLQIGAIPIIEEAGILGIVTETNLLQAYIELCWLNDGSCDDLVLNHMHRPLTCVSPDTTIDAALGEMDDRIGHLGVVEDSRLVGFLSQRDLFLGISREMIEDARAQESGELSETGIPVSTVMSSNVLTVGPEEGLCACAKTMVGRHVSALPVIENGEPVGILTQRDILENYAHLARE